MRSMDGLNDEVLFNMGAEEESQPSRAHDEGVEQSSQSGRSQNGFAYYGGARSAARRVDGEHFYYGGQAGQAANDFSRAGAGGPQRERAAGGWQQHDRPPVRSSVEHWEGYDPSFLNRDVPPVPPNFRDSANSQAGWVQYRDALEEGSQPVPVRITCQNIPVEMFQNNAERIGHMRKDQANPMRCAAAAALLSLAWAGTSKGFSSGRHAEDAREEDDGKKKRVTRRDRYVFVSPQDPEVDVPMYTMCYEEVRSRDKTKVLAVRILKLEYDQEHSDSELIGKVLRENAMNLNQSGMAHRSTMECNQQAVKEHQQIRQFLVGRDLSTVDVEKAAGLLYTMIPNEATYKQIVDLYSGRTDKSAGCPVVPDFNEAVPAGWMNQRLGSDPERRYGSKHPLAYEYLFSPMVNGLSAGLVHLDGTPMDVHPDQINIDTYIDQVTGAFRIGPSEERQEGDEQGAWIVDEKKCFWFNTRSAVGQQSDHPMDMPLPRTLAGAVTPGDTLLQMFIDLYMEGGRTIGDPNVLDQFNNVMTGEDQFLKNQQKTMMESVSTFDTVGATTNERVQTNGMKHYGEHDSDNAIVVEEQEILKDIAQQSNRVYEKVIAKAKHEEEKKMEKKEAEIREAHKIDDDHLLDEQFAALRTMKREWDAKHHAAMQELAVLHLSYMERAFTSKADRKSIPAGYKKLWDGFHQELDKMPNRSANIALGLGQEQVARDRTTFGHIWNWLGQFFEDDCALRPAPPTPFAIPCSHAAHLQVSSTAETGD